MQSFAASGSGWIYATVGDWDRAIEACQRSFERAPDPLATTYALGYQGYAYLEKGDLAQAIPLLEQAVQRLGQFRLRQTQGRFITFLSEAYLLDGHIEKARELALQGLGINRDLKSWWEMGCAQRVLGRVAQASGALAEAEAQLKEALATFASVPARFEVGRTHLALAELANAQGNQEATSTHLREAHHLFRVLRVPTYVERTERLAKEFGVSLPEGTVC